MSIEPAVHAGSGVRNDSEEPPLPVRFHLGFPHPSLADVTMEEWIEVARLAESLGFDTLWHSNERFHREMFIRMSVTSMVTGTIGIGGAIADPFAVHPMLTAQSLATLSELSNGRATIALGAGGSGFRMMGVKRIRPARALREAHELISGLLAGEVVDMPGEIVHAEAAELDFVPHQPASLWIASRGDVTLRMAGAVADGVIIGSYATPAGITAALDLIGEGASRAGRSIAGIRTMPRVDTCIHDDGELAKHGARRMISRILTVSYPDRSFVERCGLVVPRDVEDRIATRGFAAVEEIENLIPDEFVSQFSWAGDPATIAERVSAIARVNPVTDIGFWGLRAAGQSLADVTSLIGASVVPLIASKLAEN